MCTWLHTTAIEFKCSARVSICLLEVPGWMAVVSKFLAFLTQVTAMRQATVIVIIIRVRSEKHIDSYQVVPTKLNLL